MDNNLIILRYQENFADNLSAIAYGKILSKNNNKKCYYENSTEQRDIFEKQMTHFNTYFDYISKGSVNRITKEAFLLNNDFFYDKKSKKHIKKDKRNRILDLKYFNIDDIDLIDDDIKKACSFKNLDFIINYDILENIKNTNSVGLYIDKKDVENDDVDFDYIERAQKRLNKYLKKPRLFIFVDRKYNSKLKLNFDMKHSIVNLYDWREEFYFLTNCKHKIILNSANSYSEGFWASVLNEKSYNLNVIESEIKTRKIRPNWIRE